MSQYIEWQLGSNVIKCERVESSSSGIRRRTDLAETRDMTHFLSTVQLPSVTVIVCTDPLHYVEHVCIMECMHHCKCYFALAMLAKYLLWLHVFLNSLFVFTTCLDFSKIAGKTGCTCHRETVRK